MFGISVGGGGEEEEEEEVVGEQEVGLRGCLRLCFLLRSRNLL